MKKAYHNLDCQFHPNQKDHLQASDVMLMVNYDKEELEDTFRYNVKMREQELVRKAHNYIAILSDSSSSSSSDDSLETSSNDSPGSGSRQE